VSTKIAPSRSTGRITLRSAFGSHAEVLRVFSYDPGRGTACVLLREPDANVHECVAIADLEALDGDRKFVSVSGELKRRAEHTIN
jgi:hypothetical protein